MKTSPEGATARPDGLANRSGLVGRNLMRHGVDLYLVFTRARGDPRSKEIGLSDFYVGAGEKLGINKRTFAVPCNVRAYDGHISVEWMYDRLSSKAKKLLAVCRSYIYDDNTDWDYSLDFNC